MDKFGRRTDEELAAILYGRGKPEPESQSVESEELEETEEEPEERKPVPADRGLMSMLTGDDRLMDFLETDIQRLEKEQLEDEQRVERNRRKYDEDEKL